MFARSLVAVAATGLALVGAAVTAGAAQDGPTPPSGSTFGGIHLVAFQQQGNQPSTPAQFQLIARSDDMVVAQPHVMSQIAGPLKADNPNIQLLVYENGMFSTNTDPSGMPESWYLHSSNGHRVQSKNKGNTLMNPLSTAPFTSGGVTYDGWTGYVAKECLRDQLPQTSGCYVDMLGPGPTRPAYNAGGAVPVDPRTGKPFDPVAYEAMTSAQADVVRAALPAGSTVIGNGYSNANAYYTRGSWQLNKYTDSAQAQSWLGRNDLNEPLKQWQESVQMIMDNGAAGSSMIVHYGPVGVTNVTAQRTFALATYLLGNSGHAYFDFMANNLHTWESWSPLYDVHLGTPTQTASTVAGYLTNGVYQRTYSGGVVIVNPGSSQVKLNFAETYYTTDGQATTSLTVPAHSAAILTC